MPLEIQVIRKQLDVNSNAKKKTYKFKSQNEIHFVFLCYLQGSAILGSYAGILKGHPAGQMSGTGQYVMFTHFFFIITYIDTFNSLYFFNSTFDQLCQASVKSHSRLRPRSTPGPSPVDHFFLSCLLVTYPVTKVFI